MGRPATLPRPVTSKKLMDAWVAVTNGPSKYPYTAGEKRGRRRTARGDALRTGRTENRRGPTSPTAGGRILTGHAQRRAADVSLRAGDRTSVAALDIRGLARGVLHDAVVLVRRARVRDAGARAAKFGCKWVSFNAETRAEPSALV